MEGQTKGNVRGAGVRRSVTVRLGRAGITVGVSIATGAVGWGSSRTTEAKSLKMLEGVVAPSDPINRRCQLLRKARDVLQREGRRGNPFNVVVVVIGATINVVVIDVGTAFAVRVVTCDTRLAIAALILSDGVDGSLGKIWSHDAQRNKETRGWRRKYSSLVDCD